MGAAAVPILLAVGTAAGIGSSAYSSKRAHDQAGRAADKQQAEMERISAADREQKLQGELGDSVAAERRRERAQRLLASGRAGTIKTTPLGVMGDPSMAGPKYRIGV